MSSASGSYNPRLETVRDRIKLLLFSSLIGCRVQTLDWYREWWPWM